MWYKLSFELFNSVRCCSFDWHMETLPAPQIYSSQGLPSLLPRGLERDWHHRLPRTFVIHCSRPLCLCMICFPNVGDEIFSREFAFCLYIYMYISCVSLWLEYFNMIIIEKGVFNELNDVATARNQYKWSLLSGRFLFKIWKTACLPAYQRKWAR